MDHLELTQAFIEQCERTPPIANLAATFQAALERLGFCYFACCSHVDPLHPPRAAVVLHNYPAQWVRVYSESRLHEIDPVLRYAERSPLPFLWDAPAFRTQLTAQQGKLLAAADTFGLAHGYTIPIHLSWTPGARYASCSVVPRAGADRARNYLELQLMVSYLYVALNRAHALWNAMPPVVLSYRERQCLALVAQGKDDWAAGRLLRLSPVTIHTYIERAKRRLQVGTRMQAVVQALMGRQISFGDVVRAQDIEPRSIEEEIGKRRIVARSRLKRLEHLARTRH